MAIPGQDVSILSLFGLNGNNTYGH